MSGVSANGTIGPDPGIGSTNYDYLQHTTIHPNQQPQQQHLGYYHQQHNPNHQPPLEPYPPTNQQYYQQHLQINQQHYYQQDAGLSQQNESWLPANNVHSQQYHQQAYYDPQQYQQNHSYHHQPQQPPIHQLSSFVNHAHNPHSPPPQPGNCSSTVYPTSSSASSGYVSQASPPPQRSLSPIRPGPGSSPGAVSNHMMPVRLQNMAKGARTKAGMRKLMQMQEQQAKSSASSLPSIKTPPSNPKKSKGKKSSPASTFKMDSENSSLNSTSSSVEEAIEAVLVTGRAVRESPGGIRSQSGRNTPPSASESRTEKVKPAEVKAIKVPETSNISVTVNSWRSPTADPRPPQSQSPCSIKGKRGSISQETLAYLSKSEDTPTTSDLLFEKLGLNLENPTNRTKSDKTKASPPKKRRRTSSEQSRHSESLDEELVVAPRTRQSRYSGSTDTNESTPIKTPAKRSPSPKHKTVTPSSSSNSKRKGLETPKSDVVPNARKSTETPKRSHKKKVAEVAESTPKRSHKKKVAEVADSTPKRSHKKKVAEVADSTPNRSHKKKVAEVAESPLKAYKKKGRPRKDSVGGGGGKSQSGRKSSTESNPADAIGASIQAVAAAILTPPGPLSKTKLLASPQPPKTPRPNPDILPRIKRKYTKRAKPPPPPQVVTEPNKHSDFDSGATIPSILNVTPVQSSYPVVTPKKSKVKTPKSTSTPTKSKGKKAAKDEMPKKSKTVKGNSIPPVASSKKAEETTPARSIRPVDMDNPSGVLGSPTWIDSIMEKRSTDGMTLKRPTVRAKPSTYSQPPPVDLKKEPGPSLKVNHGVVKFYRGSVEEDVDESLKKLDIVLKDNVSRDCDEDTPWLCIFCGLGPHDMRLGDLFGPYFVEQGSSEHNLRGKIRHVTKKEVWVHTDCALWAGDVILVGSTLRNLDEAVFEAGKVTCKICQNVGATIGCLKRGCTETAHYPCAKLNDWNLNGETFHSYCRGHVGEVAQKPHLRSSGLL